MRTITLTHRTGEGVHGRAAVVPVRDILSVQRDENGRGSIVRLTASAEPDRLTGKCHILAREVLERVADEIGGSEVMPDHDGDIAVHIVREHDEDGEHIDDIGHYLDRDEARQVFESHDGPCSLRVAYFRYHGSDEQERKGPDPAK